MLSDKELVVRARHGDLDAFGQLISRYEKTALAAALSRCRDVHVAEDVVQAALLHAFQRLETLRDATKFGAWLVQIARRRAIDAGRAHHPVTAPSDSDAFRTACEHRVEAWIEHDHLISLLERLPEHERVVVGLRYFDGHSVTQIAEIMSKPVGTVTKQLSRAVARLRSFWDTEPIHEQDRVD